MAKASDGGPTVSAGEDLPDDPYRAPETRVAGSSSDTDVRADVYSWGAIFFRVATGQEPALQPEIGALEKAGLPAGVVDLVKRCLSPMKSQRPATIAAVLEQLEGAL
jgi:hypothetical protein